MIKSTTQIPYPVLQHSQQILSALNAVTPDLHKISGMKKAVSLLKERSGVDLFENGIKIDCENKTIGLFTPDRFTLLIKIQDLLTKEKKELRIQNSCVNSTNTKKEDVGTLLSEILDAVDFPILKLRRFIMQGEIASILDKLSPKAVMNQKCSELTAEIKTLFQEIYEQLTSIPDNYTKIQIRNGYSSITSGTPKSRQLDFVQIGVPKCDYSINIVNDKKNEKMLIITLQEPEKEVQHIIVNPKNQVMKEANINRIYNFGNKTSYYSQKELDAWDFKDKLTALRDELVKYKAYLDESISVKSTIREFYSTADTGQIDKATLRILKEVKTLFDAVKAKMLKIKDAPRKNEFKRRYKIDTIMSSPSLIFRNMSLAGESVHLSFPKLNGEVCTKILVVNQRDEIIQSFFIQNDKLVKFNASSLGRSKRQDTIINYYSQEEIDNSGIKNVLEFLRSRLSVIKT